jgi:hypothetical protein
MTKRKRTKGQTTILRYYLKGTIFEKKKTVYKLFQNRFKLLNMGDSDLSKQKLGVMSV